MSVPLEKKPPVQALVLDAAPLITQHINTLTSFASTFYITPSVYKEIKDENARRNLEYWKDKLQIRHPKPEYIKKVSDFAKLTGDFNVLSANDIHIIALTYEIEAELNGGSDSHLRSFPGEKKGSDLNKGSAVTEDVEKANDDGWSTVPTRNNGDDDSTPKKKGRRRGGKKQKAKREAAVQLADQGAENVTEEKINEYAEKLLNMDINDNDKKQQQQQEQHSAEDTEDALTRVAESAEQDNQSIADTIESQQEDEGAEEGDEEDDDGEWITAENLQETIQKDGGEQVEETDIQSKVALSSQDFAVQNVAIQIGLKLMNPSTGLQIKRIRNYMMRCHACFKLQPITATSSKHFCTYCGGATLLRCSVIVDAKTGDLKPLLKKNFEWHHKGNRYSIASPLSKNTQKKLGKGGFQHNKNSKNFDAYNNVPILREDQKEYGKAIKNEQWVQKQNEKFLENWIGGGSADNFYSPFANGDSSNRYNSSVKVNAGRYVNSTRRKR